MDPSPLVDDPRYAHRSRAPARGLCLARRRPHREIAHHLGSTGSITEVPRSRRSRSTGWRSTSTDSVRLSTPASTGPTISVGNNILAENQNIGYKIFMSVRDREELWSTL